MEEKLKQLNTAKGWLWCAVILSFLINIMFIGQSYMIYLSTDEQGPFAVAALLNGVDWSPTTKNLPYYSYGYAFILAPIFALTNSARAMYQGAIVVNALMGTAIVPIAWSIGRRLNRELPEKLMVAIAFCIGHYSSVIVRTHMAHCEMLLIFLVWMLAWLSFSIEDRPKMWKYLLFGGLALYGYMVHQRMLAVVIGGGIALAVYLFKQFTAKGEGKEVRKKLLIMTAAAAVLMAALFFLHEFLKDIFKSALWEGGSRAEINDFSDVAGRFTRYLNWSGVKTLVKSFFGHMYYMGTATLLFGFIGVFCLLRSNWKNLLALFSKKRELSAYPMSRLFILSAFGVSLVVSMFYIAGGTSRADYLVYGRYIEMTFGPILLIALLFLLSKKEKTGLFSILSAAVIVVSTLVTDYAYGNVRYVEFIGTNCVGINIFRYDGYVHVYTGLYVALICFAVAYLAFRRAKPMWNVVVLAAVAGFWIYTGANLLWNVILPAEKATYEYSRMLDARTEGTEDWPVYYTGPSGLTYEAPFIQYLLKDSTLHYIDTADIHSLQGDHYAMNRHSPIEMQEGYTLTGASHEVFIYKYDGSEMDNVIELPVSLFQSISGTHTEEGLVNASPGFLMYGPYLTLIAGSYHVEIQYEILSEGADGYFDVSRGEVTHAANHFSQNTCDENGIYTANLDFCLIDTWNREEIRCYVNAGQLRILGAKLTYTRDMVDIPLSLYNTTGLGQEDELGVVNTGPGRLFAGPYNNWYLGEYEIQIEYEVLSEDLAGYFAIYSEGEELDMQPIDLNANQAVLHVSVGASRRAQMDLCCEIASGQIRITNVTILREMEE